MRLTKLKWSVLALAVATLFSGCAEQDPDLWIFAALAPDDECEFSVPSGNNFDARIAGVLDVSFGGSYVLGLGADNTLVPSESVGFTSTGGTGGLSGNDWEANRVNIQEVSLRFDAPDPVDGAFRTTQIPVSMGIDPGGTVAMVVEIIPASVTQALQGLILTGQTVSLMVELEMTGEKLSEASVGSNTFQFPITLCNGCLWGLSVDTDGEPVTICNSGQDQASCTLNPVACDGGVGVVGPDGETLYVPTNETGLFFHCPGETVDNPVCN